MPTVAEQFVGRLKAHGVRYVFGIPSGSWLYYMEAMRSQELDFVLVSNEASGGFMAEACARLTGTLAACYGTVGPGATNLSTGVVGGLLDRTPMIALTSVPPEKLLGRTVQMAIDQQTLFRPISKWTTQLSEGRVDQVVDQAMRIATEEVPGPVHIALPEDIGQKTIPATDAIEPHSRAKRPTPRHPDPVQLERAAKIFAAARKPVLAVGLTAVRTVDRALLARVAEKHGIPVVLTPMAKGMLSEDHDWYAGVLFHALSDKVAETHREADLIVSIGYDPVEFNFEDWMPRVPLLHFDTVEADIDRTQYHQVFDVLGDPQISLEYLAQLPELGSMWNRKVLAERRASMFAKLEPPAGTFGPRAALSILREQLPQDGIMACDVGAHTHLIGQAWRTPAPDRLLMTNGCSSMGFGVPAAIAAKLCRPDKKVACVTGDGGFLMMAGEMAVARRRNLGVVFVVLADQHLALIDLKQQKKGFSKYSVSLHEDQCPTPDTVFGVPVLRADNAAQYRQALAQAFAANGPVIVEAHIDPAEYGELILKRHK